MTILSTGCTPRPFKEQITLLPVNSFMRQWVFPLDLSARRDSIRALYLRDDTLFAYSDRNLVTAIVAASGKGMFSVEVTPDQLPLKPPLVVRDKFAFPTGATLEVYSKSGKPLDSVETTRSMHSGGCVLGDTVYVGLDYPGGGRLAAIDLTRRFDRTRWEIFSRYRIASAPAVYQNVIYFADDGGAINAVSEQRDQAWSSAFQADGPIRADLKSDEGAIYAACMDTKLYCLDAVGGRLRWQYYATVPLADSPVIVGDTVYQAMPGIGVAAIDKTQGKSNRDAKWIARNATKFLSRDDKFVYLRALDNGIIACSRATGEEVFHSRRDDLVAFATNTKSSTIYASTRDGKVMAITPVIKPGAVGNIARLDSPSDSVQLDAVAMDLSISK